MRSEIMLISFLIAKLVYIFVKIEYYKGENNKKEKQYEIITSSDCQIQV